MHTLWSVYSDENCRNCCHMCSCAGFTAI